jgi:hypothetical protein
MVNGEIKINKFKNEKKKIKVNPWNLEPDLNQEAEFQTNLFLRDEIVKKNINFENLQKK